MKICAVICELNPCHFGHQALFDAARENGATHIAAILSGDFVQRGEPALLPKWERAAQALSIGADLVIELPVPFATAGAETFAKGGVSLAGAIDADFLAYGSECADLKALHFLADTLLSEKFSECLNNFLSEGISFAAARQKAVEVLCGKEMAALLKMPNNILAVEYEKAKKELHLSMDSLTIPRLGAMHDSLCDSSFQSSSRIRQEIFSDGDWFPMMPEKSAVILKKTIAEGHAPASFKYAERAVLYALRKLQPEDLARLPDISEGLENRIYAAVRSAASLESLYTQIKTKRYPLSRIRRIILSAFLGIQKADTALLPPYLRILAIGKRGQELLHFIKSNTNLPIITHSSDHFALDSKAFHMIELEHLASDLYALCMPVPRPCGSDLTHGIIVSE